MDPRNPRDDYVASLVSAGIRYGAKRTKAEEARRAYDDSSLGWNRVVAATKEEHDAVEVLKGAGAALYQYDGTIHPKTAGDQS